MIGDPPFPISIDELTHHTLTEAIGTPIESFTTERIGADRGMLGEIFVVRPAYAAGSSGPEAVICKFAALREEALASSLRASNNLRELLTYDQLLADTGVSTPHYYHGWYDPATAHFLLVQEAIVADTSVDQVEGIGPELAALVCTEAAKLHHGRWEDPSLADLDWFPRLDDDRRMNNLTTLATNGWEPLCDLVGDQFTDADRALGAAFPEQLRKTLRALAELPSTFIHSDLRADNLLFTQDHESVALIDWQGAGIGPGSFDIAYMLSQSLTTAARRAHGKSLIRGYLSALQAAGTTQSYDDFMAGYEPALLYGLAVACAMPLISDMSQPRARALAIAMATRSLTALRDHDQLWG